MNFNQFLSSEELKGVFDAKEWDSLNFVLDAFSSSLKIEKTEHVTQNLELLGQIHQATNLDQYTKKDFRIKLFERLPPTEQERFFNYCGITDKVSKMSFEKFRKCVNEVVGFEWGNNTLTKQFLLFSNLPDYLIPDETLEIKTQETVTGDGKNYEKEEFKPLKMLHGYQSSIVYRALDELEEANSHCLIQMPTGTGKTRVAMELVAYIFNNNPEIRIVWLTNQHELLEQAHDSFIEIWNHVGKFPIELLNMWTTSSAKISQLKIPTSRVLVFGTYDILNNSLDKGINLDADYIVIDEAHQILAPTFKLAKDRITNTRVKETRLLGLTATPGRGIDEEQNVRLVSEFHKNIVKIEFYGFDKEKYKNKPIQYLEDHEILSKTIPVKLHTDFEMDFSPEEWESIKKSSIKTGTGDKNEFKEKSFKKMANDNVRNILIIKKLKEYADAGKKILYFSTDLKQSLFIFTVLQQLGINAIHVQHGIDRTFRRQIIQKFKDTKEIDIICNYGIFSTGFDVPNLDVVFIARPVNSPVLFNQIAGRGTRGLKMNGTAEHILLQVIDKIPPKFADVNPYEQFDFWDDVWIHN